ncbi:uncharacterized protein N7483_006448 [Penicillium malachiteum]|uniref:uncharacterized protein n=1 Tax=Penicillium malachiteum TaxID=1324776 RepID=UPI0025489822|nr:uncharacterized protein N7483_006448 [Penicillium malachiteum]KAJ5725091.1 hypothetical protein N7483_006448 [Penicillium malachiteum]
MYPKESGSHDYASSEHEDEERSSLEVYEEGGFLSSRILDRSQELPSNSFSQKWLGHLIFTAIWIILLFIAVILLKHDSNRAEVSLASVFDTELRPIQSALEVHKTRFSGNLVFDDNGTLVETSWDPDSPKYTGEPSDELDTRWKDLYRVDGVDLRGTEADTIRGQTLTKPGGWSIVGVDVFHQLHCLDMLRQGLRRDYYTIEHDDEPASTIHMNHCLDYLRQAVMCNVDVTPILVSWDDKKNQPLADFEMEHTCRNFWKVRDWAIERSDHKHKFKDDDPA